MSASGRTRTRSIDRREPTPYEEAMVAYEKKMKEWEAKLHFDMYGSMTKERYDEIMDDKYERHTALFNEYRKLIDKDEPVPTAITNRMNNLEREINIQHKKFSDWYEANPQPVKPEEPEEPEEQEKECDEEGVCVISGGKTRKAKKSKKSKAKKAKKSKKSKKSKAKKSKAKKSKKYRH